MVQHRAPVSSVGNKSVRWRTIKHRRVGVEPHKRKDKKKWKQNKKGRERLPAHSGNVEYAYSARRKVNGKSPVLRLAKGGREKATVE